jgi:lipid A 4'-phosphatase
LLIGAALGGVLFGFLFQGFPHLDIAIAEFLRSACDGGARHNGWCHENGALWTPRWLAMAICGAVLIVAVHAAIRSWRLRHSVTAPRWKAAAFLIVTFILGPGLLANVALKDNWGRARPREVVELGGTHAFTPPLIPSGACDSNCSFVSGEASGVFALAFAGALLLPHASTAILAIGVCGGLLTGLIRMSTGGHFLSDVLFAGVLMALAALLAHALVYGTGRVKGSLSRNQRPRASTLRTSSPIPHVLLPIEVHE